MTEQPFNFHVDPGHGWLEVPADDIAAVGLTAAAFSTYTYVDTEKPGGPIYYLEEDCDLPLFVLAYGNRQFRRPNMVTVYHDGDCFCRNLGRNIAV